MERRRFIEICAVSGGCMGAANTQASAASPAVTSAPQPATKRTGVTLKPKAYERVKLVDRDGKPIKAKSLKTNHNYVFNYPFEGTPCFLLGLDDAVAGKTELLTEAGDAYTALAGVGPKKNFVAYSAICAHKLAYPSPQVSFISFRDKSSPLSSKRNVIGCCADKSVYDPFHGAKVLGGPAPQPLASIVLEHDAKTDELYAVATLGSDKFAAFFDKYAFKLSLEKGNARAASPVSKTTILRDLSAHSQQTAQC
jgi:arsenite oxidase small subunit